MECWRVQNGGSYHSFQFCLTLLCWSTNYSTEDEWFWTSMGQELMVQTQYVSYINCVNLLTHYQPSSERYFHRDCYWLALTCSQCITKILIPPISQRFMMTFQSVSLSDALVQRKLSLTATCQILICIFMIKMISMLTWPPDLSLCNTIYFKFSYSCSQDTSLSFWTFHKLSSCANLRSRCQLWTQDISE